MSTTTITRTFDVGGVLTDMTSVIFSNVAGTIGVRRLDTGANVVAPGTPLNHTGLGKYEYSFVDPAPGLTYNYYVQFVYLGETYTIEKNVVGGTAGGVPGTLVAKALPDSCISLARYCEILGINECAFWGINTGSNIVAACDHIWTQNERNRIARYLAEAQGEIEQVTQYPLCPRWFVGEQHPYRIPLHTKWMKVIESGVKASTDILAGAAVNYATDPAVVTAPTTLTDTDEIHVFYPGSDREIDYDTIDITAGVLTITIPWCRLVDPSEFNNPTEGLDYNDPTIYTSTVDIVRVYNDATSQGKLVYPHQASACSDCCTCPSCGESTHDACVYVRNGDTGAVDVLKATLTDGVLVADSCYCNCSYAQFARVNYRAGMNPITAQAEDAIIRLAHAKMPKPPCGCDLVQEAWTRDRNVPEVLDRERLNCPFGLSDGAWVAWRFANALKAYRLGVI